MHFCCTAGLLMLGVYVCSLPMAAISSFVPPQLRGGERRMNQQPCGNAATVTATKQNNPSYSLPYLSYVLQCVFFFYCVIESTIWCILGSSFVVQHFRRCGSTATGHLFFLCHHMDQIAVSEWSVVGTFRKRPVPQGPIIDFTSHLNKRGSLSNEEDIPVLLYDAKTDENQQRSRVPRYLARRIDIPSPSLHHVNVVSLAPPRSTDAALASEPLPNVDCVEPITTFSRHKDGVRRKHPFVIGTVLPAPPQLALLLPLVIFLADIALLVVSLTTYLPGKGLIAACCLLVLVPDMGALVLLLKRGIYSTTIAIHLLLWPNVVLLFIQPFVSLLFMIHFLLIAVMVLYCLRVRASTYTTFCTLR